MIVEIGKPSKHNTKYDARIDGTQTVSFGDSNYQDLHIKIMTENKDT